MDLKKKRSASSVASLRQVAHFHRNARFWENGKEHHDLALFSDLAGIHRADHGENQEAERTGWKRVAFFWHRLRDQEGRVLPRKVNLESIRKTVVKAAEGMKYLQGVAKVAAGAGVSLSWLSPSGIPVHHRYMKWDSRTVSTAFGGTSIRMSLATNTDTIDKRKSRASIAPNFIHSRDAAHPVLTVNACLDA